MLIKRRTLILSLCFMALWSVSNISAAKKQPERKFAHPGILFTMDDLKLMKSKIENREEPWASAYENVMKDRKKPEVVTKTFAHVVSGPYNNPDIGATDLSNSASVVYDYALMWHLTGDEYYAKTAIDVFEKWSKLGIWTFDENNTKLLAALTCNSFVNAAEILRYTYPGWTDAHTRMVSSFLNNSFYPVLRYYNPQANGNWDGAIIRALLGIAVFTDNVKLFDNAVNHYKYSYANGSIVKYIYPDGQCQEATRDWGHVMMGLGLFSDAARIAWSQGVDLYSLADNRLALAYEYSASYLMGEEPHCYGIISPKYRDCINMETMGVVDAYRALGYDMPWSRRYLKEKIEGKYNGMNVLTSYRAEFVNKKSSELKPLLPSKIAYHVGSKDDADPYDRSQAIEVKPGQSIQDAVNRSVKENKVVVLLPGQHRLEKTLQLPSNTHIIGYGNRSIILGGEWGSFCAITPAEQQGVENITLENFILEAAKAYGIEPQNEARFTRGDKFHNEKTGINFCAHAIDGYKNITIKNVTVNNFSRNGVILSGVSGFTIENCDFSDNGSQLVPGSRITHNLKLVCVNKGTVKNSRFDTSLKGCGIYADRMEDVTFDGCEVARNGWFGVVVNDSRNISFKNSLIEGSDRSAICLAFQDQGSENITLSNNIFRLNNGYGVESYKTQKLVMEQNRHEDNRLSVPLDKISQEPDMLLEDISMEQ